MTESMTYADAGVDYEALKWFKKLAMAAAQRTAHFDGLDGCQFHVGSRGKSTYRVSIPVGELGFTIEALGSKMLVADAMGRERYLPRDYYNIAIDAVAATVNDIVASGIPPKVIGMFLGLGSSHWFRYPDRCKDLIRGFADGCELARCTWGPGETQVLPGLIYPEAALLAAPGFGLGNHDDLIGSPIPGDIIILLHSSGIHTNGLSLARKIAEKLPDGYVTKLPNGQRFGDSLLMPSIIYVQFILACLKRGINIHGAEHITGSGWRKLMRAEKPLTYVIEENPPVPNVFTFMQKHGPISDYEAYQTFNMGAGFALFVREADIKNIWAVLEHFDFGATVAGRVIQEGEHKKVVITPKNITFTANR